MPNRAQEYPDEVFCPLVEQIIPAYDCIEIQDCASGMLANVYGFDFLYTDWKPICRNCKYHEY